MPSFRLWRSASEARANHADFLTDDSGRVAVWEWLRRERVEPLYSEEAIHRRLCT
jgi:hypothetical protein